MSKLIIVNHSEDTMELLKKYLINKGLDVKCTTEDEAIPVTKKFKPDVALIDVLQINAAKNMKKDEEISHIPIVLMTGHMFNHKDYTNIVDEVIQKPFDPKELEVKIQKVIKKKLPI